MNEHIKFWCNKIFKRKPKANIESKTASSLNFIFRTFFVSNVISLSRTFTSFCCSVLHHGWYISFSLLSSSWNVLKDRQSIDFFPLFVAVKRLTSIIVCVCLFINSWKNDTLLVSFPASFSVARILFLFCSTSSFSIQAMYPVLNMTQSSWKEKKQKVHCETLWWEHMLWKVVEISQGNESTAPWFLQPLFRFKFFPLLSKKKSVRVYTFLV